jgi:hypothetical protein
LSSSSIRIYDISGRLSQTLALDASLDGMDGRNERGEALPAGVYVVVLRTNHAETKKRLVLIR